MPTLAANCVIAPVPPWRRWLVAGLAGILVLGHGYDTLVRREHWPFSYYPMYSRVQTRPRLDVLGLYGVVQQGSRTRLEPMSDPAYLPPLQEVHLRNILMAAWGRDGGGAGARRNTAKILNDYSHAYESRRIAGLHRGPMLKEVQLGAATYLLHGGATGKPNRIRALLGVTAQGVTHEYAATQPTTSAIEDEADGVP